jgi:hypothetical protein
MNLVPKKPDEIKEVPKTPEIKPEKEKSVPPLHPEIPEKIVPDERPDNPAIPEIEPEKEKTTT